MGMAAATMSTTATDAGTAALTTPTTRRTRGSRVTAAATTGMDAGTAAPTTPPTTTPPTTRHRAPPPPQPLHRVQQQAPLRPPPLVRVDLFGQCCGVHVCLHCIERLGTGAIPLCVVAEQHCLHAFFLPPNRLCPPLTILCSFLALPSTSHPSNQQTQTTEAQQPVATRLRDVFGKQDTQAAAAAIATAGSQGRGSETVANAVSVIIDQVNSGKTDLVAQSFAQAAATNTAALANVLARTAVTSRRRGNSQAFARSQVGGGGAFEGLVCRVHNGVGQVSCCSFISCFCNMSCRPAHNTPLTVATRNMHALLSALLLLPFLHPTHSLQCPTGACLCDSPLSWQPGLLL